MTSSTFVLYTKANTEFHGEKETNCVSFCICYTPRLSKITAKFELAKPSLRMNDSVYRNETSSNDTLSNLCDLLVFLIHQ